MKLSFMFGDGMPVWEPTHTHMHTQVRQTHMHKVEVLTGPLGSEEWRPHLGPKLGPNSAQSNRARSGLVLLPRVSGLMSNTPADEWTRTYAV